MITLRAANGAQAQITPEFGMNCFSWQVPTDTDSLELLWSEPGFATGEKRPSGSGIPLLFPFPGRLRGTTFEHDGQTYEIPPGDGRGNAIHGFVLNRAWQVTEQEESAVTAAFRASRDAPEVLQMWPADFEITVGYRLEPHALRTQIQIHNPDTRPLPWGLGAHPYFRLPLGAGAAADCRVQLPVSSEWELDEMLPTGVRKPLSNAAAFRKGVPFGDLQLDNVFTDLEEADGQRWATIFDDHNGRKLSLHFSTAFRECVVYNPPHREAICIEPYSCVPGAQGLTQVDSGWRTLAAGDTAQFDVDYVLSPA